MRPDVLRTDQINRNWGEGTRCGGAVDAMHSLTETPCVESRIYGPVAGESGQVKTVEKERGRIVSK